MTRVGRDGHTERSIVRAYMTFRKEKESKLTRKGIHQEMTKMKLELQKRGRDTDAKCHKQASHKLHLSICDIGDIAEASHLSVLVIHLPRPNGVTGGNIYCFLASASRSLH